MNIRFKVISEDVIKILEQVDNNKRKYFIEEAVLNYYQMLKYEVDKNSIYIKVKKDENAVRFYR